MRQNKLRSQSSVAASRPRPVVGRAGMGRAAVLLACLPTVALVLALSGCTSSCLTTRCDQDRPPLGLPPAVEHNPDPVLVAKIPLGPDPATILDPDRPPRFLSLQEAFAMALENGTVGLQAIGSPGQVREDLASFGATAGLASDAVRVLALQPAIAAAQLEGSLSRFDPVWSTGMTWRQVDEPVQGLSSFSNGKLATFSTTLAKPLPTGGVAGVSFVTDYRLLSQPPTGAFSVLNPTYTSRLEVGVDQPLLRGFGVETNQLLSSFPSSSLFPNLGPRFGGFGEGILVARLRFDQQRAEFERNLHYLVFNVESAYWNLYGAYVNLYAAEQGLRQAHAAWSIGKDKFDAGSIDAAQFALLRAQFEEFRARRLEALNGSNRFTGVLDSERRLRILLGLKAEDGTRLVPSDAPNLTPYQPHWQAALGDCLTMRPELMLARQEVEARHRGLKAQENSLLPDLRFQANYSAVGLGTRLDGSADAPDGSPASALRNLSGNHFNNWTLGLALNVPLGFRAENARVRQARLELGQAYLNLRDQERRAETTLASAYSRLITNFKLIEARTQQRKALAEQLEVRFRKYALGAKESTLEFLLQAQQQWADAIQLEYQAIVDYNTSLAAFEFSRGTILAHNRINIAEGPLPQCADVRAVEHERERTEAIVLRERSCPPLATVVGGTALPWPDQSAPSVPALMSVASKLPTTLEGTATAPSLALKDDPRFAAAPTMPPGLPPVTAPGMPATASPATDRPWLTAPMGMPVPEPTPRGMAPAALPVGPAIPAGPSPAPRAGASLGLPQTLE